MYLQRSGKNPNHFCDCRALTVAKKQINCNCFHSSFHPEEHKYISHFLQSHRSEGRQTSHSAVQFILFIFRFEFFPLFCSFLSSHTHFCLSLVFSSSVHSSAHIPAKPKLKGHWAVCKSIWNASVCGNRIRLVNHTSLVPPLPFISLSFSSSLLFFPSKAYSTISSSYRKA